MSSSALGFNERAARYRLLDQDAIDERSDGKPIDNSRSSRESCRMKISPLKLAFLVLPFLLAVAACGSDNKWCNGQCAQCPGSVNSSCVGKVGNQCCYCPLTYSCDKDSNTCKCFTYVAAARMVRPASPDIDRGLQAMTVDPVLSGAAAVEVTLEGETLSCR
jgi:hypothetical protein